MPSISPSPQQDYLWVVLGDIHDDVRRLKDIPELPEADGVIITGDLTVAGSVKQAERVLEVVRQHTDTILAQIGNMDRAEITDWLTEKGWNLHAAVRELAPGIAIFGVGASTFTPFGTPSEFPESRFAAWLEEGWKRARASRQTVLVSHNPPKDTACDLLPNGMHVGSSAVREFIQEAQPDICLCGHIHEARAMDRIGRTVVINPGTLASGGYVVLRSNSGSLSAELRMLEAEHSEA